MPMTFAGTHRLTKLMSLMSNLNICGEDVSVDGSGSLAKRQKKERKHSKSGVALNRNVSQNNEFVVNKANRLYLYY